MNSDQIKNRIAALIKEARRKNIDLRSEYYLASSKYNSAGQSEYFKQKVFELLKQMDHDTTIGHWWIGNRLKPDIFDSQFIFNSEWIQKYTEANLNQDHQDEEEVFRQLGIFIDQCFKLESFEYCIKESENNERGLKTNVNPRIKKRPEESIRRQVAFCFCEHFLNGKVPLNELTKDGMKVYIEETFKNSAGKPIASAHKVYLTLASKFEKQPREEKRIFSHNPSKKKWEFNSKSYDYMKSSFPEDYKTALEILKTIK